MKIFIPVLFILLGGLRGYACDCSPPKPFTKEDAQKYDYIFLANIGRERGNKIFNVEIVEIFKGDVPGNIKIDNEYYHSCITKVKTGEKWLIYANKALDDIIKLELCTRSRNIERPISLPPPPMKGQKKEMYKKQLEEYKRTDKGSLNEELQALRSL
jgi:hypothetical protein